MFKLSTLYGVPENEIPQLDGHAIVRRIELLQDNLEAEIAKEEKRNTALIIAIEHEIHLLRRMND